MSRWQPYAEYRDSGVEWLGEIPEHWEVKQLKFVANVQSGVAKGRDLEGRNVIMPPYLRVANVQHGYVDLSDIATIAIAEEELDRYSLKAGDVLMTEGGDFDKLGRGTVWEAQIDPCVHQNHIFAIRPHRRMNPYWISTITQTDYARHYFILRSKQSTNLASISSTNLMELPVVLPPDAEQVSILSHVERETTRIDALVAKQEQLIALLQEKRAALISHAVTKGLDPDVEMKDSGIPSIGQIPSHWQSRRNKHIFRELNERSETGEEELLSVSHITGVTPRTEKEVYMFMAESMEGYKLCYPGDLVINTMWAWMGALGVTEYTGIVSPSYHVYRLSEQFAAQYAPKYLDLLYRTPGYVCEITRHSRGVWTSRLRLYPDSFFEMYTVTPPLSEQQQVIERIADQVQEMDILVGKSRQLIERLQEYRTALISAAVTGKIDVRGEV